MPFTLLFYDILGLYGIRYTLTIEYFRDICHDMPWSLLYRYTVYKHGYGSIPINTIFSGMNIHLPAILMWTTGVQGFDTLPHHFQTPPRFHRWNRAAKKPPAGSQQIHHIARGQLQFLRATGNHHLGGHHRSQALYGTQGLTPEGLWLKLASQPIETDMIS